MWCLREGTVAMLDGRRVGFAEFGVRGGRPVLHFHGMPGGRFYDLDAAALHETGTWLLTVERPGIGLSDPQPGRRVLDWPADVEQVANAFGIRRYHRVAASAMEDSASLVIALAYERIRTYPFERRPRRNRRQRAARHATTAAADRRPAASSIVSLESLPFEPAGDDWSHDESCALLDETVAQRVIASRDAELIALTRLRDHPVAELAAHLGCPAQTLRQRRRRAEVRLLALL